MLALAAAVTGAIACGCGGTSMTTGLEPEHEDEAAETAMSGTQPAAGTASIATISAAEALRQQQLRGREVFEAQCMGCHAINGEGAGGPGPDLTHESAPPPPGSDLIDYRQFYSLWLDNPGFYLPDAKMPPVPLPPQQKADLIEYLMTLT